MKVDKSILILFLLPLFAFTAVHKYYISVTQVEYVEGKQSVQIVSRIFIDDFENLLRQRYDETITLAEKDENKMVDLYIEKYLKEKIKTKINGKDMDLVFVGKEYDAHIMLCYMEIENVNSIKTFNITNQVLFDVFKEQQNIVKIKINSIQKSYILISQKDNALLNFN